MMMMNIIIFSININIVNIINTTTTTIIITDINLLTVSPTTQSRLSPITA